MSSTQNTITDATGTVWSFATTPKGKAGHLVSLGKADAPTHVSYPACGQISSARTGGVYAQPWITPTAETVTCKRCAALLQQITAETAPKEAPVSSTQTTEPTKVNWSKMNADERRALVLKANRLQTPALQALINAQTRGSEAHKQLTAIKRERQATAAQAALDAEPSRRVEEAIGAILADADEAEVRESVADLLPQEVVAEAAANLEDFKAEVAEAKAPQADPASRKALVAEAKRITAEVAGVMECQYRRRTGTIVTVYLAEKAPGVIKRRGLELKTKYVVNCETHGESTGHNSLRQARYLALSAQEWCQGCMKAAREAAAK